MKIAGVLCTKNYTDECSVFETLKELTDFVIVLDNNSDKKFPYANECDEYISIDCEQWEDFGNRMTTFYRAFVHQCEWVVNLDDDIILGSSCRSRQDVANIISSLEANNDERVLFSLKALWEKDEDGIYCRSGSGLFSVIQKNPFYKPDITMIDPQKRRLHFKPDCIPIARQIISREHTAYHAGGSTQEKRMARYEKYVNELDKDLKFQNSYENLIDDSDSSISLVNSADQEHVKSKWRLWNGNN